MFFSHKLIIVSHYIILCIFLSVLAHGNTKTADLHGDGRITVYSPHLNRYAQIEFRNNNVMQPNGMAMLSKFMQQKSPEKSSIDIRLINLLDYVEDTLQTNVIELMSCYESKPLPRLPDAKTVHMHPNHDSGHACDIRAHNISARDIAALLKQTHCCGLGLYEDQNSIHIDTQRDHYWENVNLTKPIYYGTQHNPNHRWGLLSEQSFYQNADAIVFTITNQHSKVQHFSPKRFWIQAFHHGNWIKTRVHTVKYSGKRLKFGHSRPIKWIIPENISPGKYRFITVVNQKDPEPVYSNEFFILKSSQ